MLTFIRNILGIPPTWSGTASLPMLLEYFFGFIFALIVVVLIMRVIVNILTGMTGK